MKTILALVLALTLASCASTSLHPTQTVADATSDGGAGFGGTSGEKLAEDGPDLTPDMLLSLLRGDDDKATSTECDGTTPHCVAYQRLQGPIVPNSLKGLINTIKGLKEGQILMLDMNTPGGSLDEGFQLEKELEATRAKVICMVDGDAYSMGYLILQSCQTRVMTKRSNLMTHEAILYSPTASVETLSSLQAQLDDLQATASAMAEQGARRLNVPFNEYVTRTSGKPWFMTWAMAKQVNAVDCVFNGNGAEAREQLEARGELNCVK